MKTLEYIKSVMEEKIRAYEQVLSNPENYDTKTLAYAKAEKENAELWYIKALEREYSQSPTPKGAGL